MTAPPQTRHHLPRGLRGIGGLWFPILGPIGAWTVHALYIAGVARLACTRPSITTTIHVVTAATLATCAAALLGSALLARRGSDTHESDSTAGRARFLGLLGIAIGGFNIALIAAEELYVIGLYPVRCGG